MSSKEKIKKMKQKSKHAVMPKLRFPEFRNEPGWEEKCVNAISDVNPNHEGLPDSFVYIDLESVEQGKLVAQKVINRESAPSRAQRLLRKRDVIYQTVRPDQRNNLFFDVEDERDYVASTGYAQLRAHTSPVFLFQLLHTNDFVNRVLAKCTGSNYPAINSSNLAAIEVAVPSPAEQQKIADCLGSLDGLIAAQGRKLAALRDHKRGLMQQLFPQPGQTQPRLRFPEFRDKGEWVEKTLGDVSEVLMCKRIFTSETSPNGEVPFYKIGTLGGVPNAFISRDLFEEYKSKYNYPRIGEILITCSGTIGKCLPYDGGDAYFQDSNIVWIDNPSLEVSNEFLLSVLSNVNWSTLNSTTITRIYGPDLRNLSIKFPQNEDEQQRIADCLTSLDTLITAQAEKIETLKQHKRGLMQQLFPSPEVS
ncbi:MAG: restriction endonuclease subunit S [Chitinivibrionales bacterium]